MSSLTAHVPSEEMIEGSRACTCEVGTVAISVLALFIFTALVTALFAVVVTTSTKISSLHTEQRESYWLARSVARSALHSIQAGTCTPGSANWDYQEGTVQQTVLKTKIWTVTEVARVRATVSAVTFTFDPETNSILNWQDNGVP